MRRGGLFIVLRLSFTTLLWGYSRPRRHIWAFDIGLIGVALQWAPGPKVNERESK